MNDPSSAAILGYVLLALASLVGVAVGIKNLLKQSPPTSNGYGNGTHDVTRREFEEVKNDQHQTNREINNRLRSIEVNIALIKQKRRQPPQGEEPK
jgi:hypothetical protein